MTVAVGWLEYGFFFFSLNWDPSWVAVDMDMARKTASLS